MTARARQLVLEVLDSNRLNAGPMMARFEAAIASLHNRRFGLMCNSGTSALQIGLAALKERIKIVAAPATPVAVRYPSG